MLFVREYHFSELCVSLPLHRDDDKCEDEQEQKLKTRSNCFNLIIEKSRDSEMLNCEWSTFRAHTWTTKHHGRRRRWMWWRRRWQHMHTLRLHEQSTQQFFFLFLFLSSTRFGVCLTILLSSRCANTRIYYIVISNAMLNIFISPRPISMQYERTKIFIVRIRNCTISYTNREVYMRWHVGTKRKKNQTSWRVK